jgi:hypothetical protein
MNILFRAVNLNQNSFGDHTPITSALIRLSEQDVLFIKKALDKLTELNDSCVFDHQMVEAVFSLGNHAYWFREICNFDYESPNPLNKHCCMVSDRRTQDILAGANLYESIVNTLGCDVAIVPDENRFCFRAIEKHTYHVFETRSMTLKELEDYVAQIS